MLCCICIFKCIVRSVGCCILFEEWQSRALGTVITAVPTLFLYEFIAFKGDLRLALIKMEEHKSVTVQVDKAAGKIYVDGVLPNATLCLYHIRGKVIEVKQAREESASFDLPCSGEYVLVITHALSVPVVKQLVIE